MTRPTGGIHEEPRACDLPGRQPGVLVVDDTEAVRTLLDFGLRASGFAVWLAADGHEGVSIYREHGPAIDLLLLDVRMPGWDGPETLAAIRALAPDLLCCFMTGDTGHYTEQELLALGAIGVLQKPFRLGELIEQFRRLTVPGEPYDESQKDRWSAADGWG